MATTTGVAELRPNVIGPVEWCAIDRPEVQERVDAGDVLWHQACRHLPTGTRTRRPHHHRDVRRSSLPGGPSVAGPNR